MRVLFNTARQSCVRSPRTASAYIALILLTLTTLLCVITPQDLQQEQNNSQQLRAEDTLNGPLVKRETYILLDEKSGGLAELEDDSQGEADSIIAAATAEMENDASLTHPDHPVPKASIDVPLADIRAKFKESYPKTQSQKIIAAAKKELQSTAALSGEATDAELRLKADSPASILSLRALLHQAVNFDAKREPFSDTKSFSVSEQKRDMDSFFDSLAAKEKRRRSSHKANIHDISLKISAVRRIGAKAAKAINPSVSAVTGSVMVSKNSRQVKSPVVVASKKVDSKSVSTSHPFAKQTIAQQLGNATQVSSEAAYIRKRKEMLKELGVHPGLSSNQARQELAAFFAGAAKALLQGAHEGSALGNRAARSSIGGAVQSVSLAATSGHEAMSAAEARRDFERFFDREIASEGGFPAKHVAASHANTATSDGSHAGSDGSNLDVMTAGEARAAFKRFFQNRLAHENQLAKSLHSGPKHPHTSSQPVAAATELSVAVSEPRRLSDKAAAAELERFFDRQTRAARRQEAVSWFGGRRPAQGPFEPALGVSASQSLAGGDNLVATTHAQWTEEAQPSAPVSGQNYAPTTTAGVAALGQQQRAAAQARLARKASAARAGPSAGEAAATASVKIVLHSESAAKRGVTASGLLSATGKVPAAAAPAQENLGRTVAGKGRWAVSYSLAPSDSSERDALSASDGRKDLLSFFNGLERRAASEHTAAMAAAAMASASRGSQRRRRR